MLKTFAMLIVPTIVVLVLVILTKMTYDHINATVQCAFDHTSTLCTLR